MNKLHLVLGRKRAYETDGEYLLKHILCRYSVDLHLVHWHYSYYQEPATRAIKRKTELAETRKRLETEFLREPGVIIGFGWMACEVLVARGKTRLKNTVGTKWNCTSDSIVIRSAWISYDPAAALFDPNLAVDISSVILAACKEGGIETKLNRNIKPFNWIQYI